MRTKFNETLGLLDYKMMATTVMFQLIETKEEFTADNFYELARAAVIPPDLIKKFSGSLFKEFQASGYIKKTDRFALSERNGSTPLPIWIASGN